MKIRVYRQKGFTVMSNFHLMDSRLSLRAKGLLSVMLALPDTWDYTEKGLAKLSSDKATSVNSAISELIEVGYVVRERQRDEKGHLKGAIYHIFEQPKEVDQLSIFPMLGNPILGNPIQEDTTLLYEKKKLKEEIKRSSIHFANERTYTQEELDAFITDIDDIDI